MASKRIKGITIEIDGDATKLDKALKGVDSNLYKVQSDLRDVDRMLKLDPKNTILLEQKQRLLSEAISETETRLKTLKEANEKAADSVKNYDAWAKAYEPIQKEIDETQKKTAELKAKMQELKDGGKIDTDEYKKLQTELNETSDKLSGLKQQAKKVSDEFGNPISTREYDAIQREIIETENNLKGLKETAKDVTKSVEDSAGGIKGAFDDLGGKIDTGNMMAAADTAAQIGEKVIDAGKSMVDAFADVETATTRVNTYFGLTGEAAEQAGQVVENVFKSGVTDSLDAVADATIIVKNNLKDIDNATLQKITVQALNLEQVFGSDISESMRGVSALMTNFGIDAQTAMDYLVQGTQNGLDKTQELGDNISEYSGKFEQAGYSVEEYFQLLQNGLEGGAYNLDKVNDSINEVTTRLSDGTIEKAIGQFSDETERTFKAWQDGGATQKEVINSIIEDIKNATTEQDALSLAATAFGTLGEDANLGVITSLTTLGDEYSNVSGKAQQMADDAATPMQKLQGAMNDLKTELAPLGEKIVEIATDILPPLIDGITKLIDGFLNLPGPVQTFIGAIAAVLAVVASLSPVITAVMGVISALGITALLPMIGIIAGVAAAIAVIIIIIQNWGKITEWFGDLWAKICNGVQTVWETVSTAVINLITGFVDGIKSLWEGLKEAISTAMEAIRDFILSIWTAIKENPIVQAIADAVSNIFSTLSETLSGIWNGIKDIALGAWEIIKNTILAPVLLLIDLVTGDFDGLKTDLQNIWNNISEAAGRIWGGIKEIVSSIVGGIKDTVSSIWNGIKSITSTVWNTVSSTVSDLAGKAKTAAVNAFNNLRKGVSDAIKALPGIVSDIFDNIVNTISNLISSAWNWGADFIGGLKNGIMSGIQGIVDTVTGIGNKIRSILHFSRPDEGPLRDYETWMPDFMTGLAKGINTNAYKVFDAMNNLSQGMKLNVSPTQNVLTESRQSQNIYDLLKSYLPTMADKNSEIVLDDGTLVGKMIPKINRGLNQSKSNSTRGRST